MQRVYELAAGQETTVDTTTADIEFMKVIVGGTILFGESLLGFTALEYVGIEVDPPNGWHNRLQTVRFTSLRKQNGVTLLRQWLFGPREGK